MLSGLERNAGSLAAAAVFALLALAAARCLIRKRKRTGTGCAGCGVCAPHGNGGNGGSGESGGRESRLPCASSCEIFGDPAECPLQRAAGKQETAAGGGPE